MNVRFRALALAAFAMLPACATKQVSPQASKDHSLLVVHIDLSKAPSYWRKVAVLCEDRRGGKPWWHMHTDDAGLYYQEGAPVGRCWLTGGFQGGVVTRIYKLPETPDQNPTTVSIARPGVHYMGSFKYQGAGADEFRLVPTKAVSEREALRRVLPYTEGTPWNGMVRKRLGAL
jgi:hypothetical protein